MPAVKPTIIIVDDDPTMRNAGQSMLQDTYDVHAVSSGTKLFGLLEKFTPNLILLDVEMPSMDGYTVIQELKANALWAQIPVIFLTGNRDIDGELTGLSLGAADYITKPYSRLVLLRRVANQLELQNQKSQIRSLNKRLVQTINTQAQTIDDLQTGIFSVFANVIEYRDDQTGAHIYRTQQYLLALVESLRNRGIYQDEIETWDIRFVMLSSSLHDVGKIAIPDAILLKPGKLTPEEFAIMKEHAILGGQIIEDIEHDLRSSLFIRYAEIMAVSHHEKWDGSGYPYHLTEEDIPLQGRCMAIVDVYDALTSVRPYKRAFTHEEAMKIIEEGRGQHFDPHIADAFIASQDEILAVAQRSGVYRPKRMLGLPAETFAEV